MTPATVLTGKIVTMFALAIAGIWLAGDGVPPTLRLQK